MKFLPFKRNFYFHSFWVFFLKENNKNTLCRTFLFIRCSYIAKHDLNGFCFSSFSFSFCTMSASHWIQMFFIVFHAVKKAMCIFWMVFIFFFSYNFQFPSVLFFRSIFVFFFFHFFALWTKNEWSWQSAF